MKTLCKKAGITVLALLFLFGGLQAQEIPSPEKFFGFRLGSDYKLASWPKIVDYFRLLDEGSEKLRLVDLGTSTRGNPFIMAIITSKANMERLEDYRRMVRQLADPRGLSEEQARQIAQQARIVLLITCSMHATEVGATQASPELAYRLITEDTPRFRKILDNVIFLLVPCFNPDGLIMVKDWYDRYLETPYEGSPMPWLYHWYTGHDNNRDAFMLTQVESRLVTKVLYKEWFPQIYLDMHQMGNRHARLWVPPFYDPVNPNVDPLIYRQASLLGLYMATDLQAQGFKGILTHSYFTGWWQGAFLQTAWWHNVVGLLTELASVRIASPIFQRKSDLKGGVKGLRKYQRQMNFPDPWPGGWWRLRDIVDYDLAAALSLLDAAATHRENFLFNFYSMNRRAIERGKKEPPYAFLVPPDQWDPIEAAQMLDILMMGGVEVHQALEPFTADEVDYPKGTYVILMAQPYRNYAKDLLEPQEYPEMREYEGGPPVSPYDVAGWTLPYQMGVRCVQVTRPFEAQLKKMDKIPMPPGRLAGKARYAYILDHRSNHSFVAINRLLARGYEIYWTEKAFTAKGRSYPPGTILVMARKRGVHQVVDSLARELSLQVGTLNRSISGKGYRLKPIRLGVYQPWLPSMHEGWSRWVLERYEFPYKNVHNEEIRVGGLEDRYDVIYLPDIWAEGILKGREEGTVPPEYTKGIGHEGLMNLRKFVEAGGTLITMDSSSELLMGDFGLPVVNVLKDKKREDFFCPGSILRLEYDVTHPVAFGMDSVSIAYFTRSPAFKIIPSFRIKTQVVAKYPKSHLLMSGWLLGEKHLANRAAIVDIPLGKGRVLLIGFDAINRAQAHATFKVFFNAIYYGPSRLAELPR